MRAALFLLTPLALATAPAPAASPATMVAFDRSVTATKQAMNSDPEHALVSANAAVALAHRMPATREGRIAGYTAAWLQGEALLFLNRQNEAETIIDRTLADVEKVAPNTKLYGDLLRSHGAIAQSAGQVLRALHDYQRAHEVFRKAGIARSQALALQDIGMIYQDADDLPRALDYYEQSGDIYSGDPSLALTMHNNRAEVLRKQKRYAEAAAAYCAALVEAKKQGSPLLQVRILTNLAGSEAEAHRLASAEVAIDQAMRMASHGVAAGWQPYVYGIAARIAFDRGDVARAEQLIARTFAGVDLTKSELLFREYHLTAAHIYEARGDTALALAHLKAFQRLDSEAQALTASAAAQLTGARFDFANQNAKISKLKQAQLESAVQLERQRGRLTTLALGALALIAGLLAIGFASLRRSRNETRAANTVLSEVNVRLEGALKAKTDFLATTSHEIRTPLNGILGMTQILLTRCLDAETREQIEVVHGAGETMRALVDDILDVAKMETGELQVAAEPTRPRAILEETARLWRGHAETKGVALSLDMVDVPELIRSDPMRLRQVAFNLVSNAIKFTPAGTVAIRATGEGEGDARRLVIEVADSGIGIPTDQLGLIFDPFHQVDGGTTRQFGGTGLGLAICKKIAQALGGGIAVASEVGRGTSFTLTVPLLVDVAVEPAAADAPGPRERGLLLVEGNLLTQGVMRNLLEPRFPGLRCVEDVETALVAIDGGSERQLLVDAKSAAIGDGALLDGLRRLVAYARARGLHVTVLLAPSDELTIEQVVLVGADQLVLKPVSGNQLLQQLLADDTPASVARAA